VDVAKRFDLYRRVRFDTDVVCEQWDDTAAMWVLHTQTGEFITARFLISAVGAFIRPKADPGIPGWQAFNPRLRQPNDNQPGQAVANDRVKLGAGGSGQGKRNLAQQPF
jgi:cation diffusion facilitator CzcD-associated flavoprotein CzcO